MCYANEGMHEIEFNYGGAKKNKKKKKNVYINR